MGMLPNSQYGSVAVLPSISSVFEPTRVVVSTSSSLSGDVNGVLNPGSSNVVQTAGTTSSNRSVYLNSDLSALSIRATEYLQRWKEVVQFATIGTA